MQSRFINQLHHAAAKVPQLTWLAHKVRNQCESIIGYALGEDTEVTDPGNSEAWLVSLLADQIEVFVDIGANVGDWTACVLVENPEAKGVLCEPVPWCYQELLRRFVGKPNLRLLQVAVSDSVGTTPFAVMPGNAKTSSLFTLPGTSDQRCIEVELRTVDMIAKESGYDHIDFLKCDCEGFDLRVLHGARKLLSEGRVELIQFEYNHMWPKAGCTLASAFQWLASHGYQSYLLRHNGLWRFDYEKWGEFARFANFIAMKPGSSFEQRLVPQIRGEI